MLRPIQKDVKILAKTEKQQQRKQKGATMSADNCS